ncbi:hypothetical protein QE109_06750 [Fusibacter bizertensis]|jgi:hypothetical protein|uniref:Uncharacterized protein n=1 Tax=Fusibacter bizertensis TaxID=1488331 RepID=A0ABT6NBP7_9FIRM|nr:hypothetical protein [Fusibacter bizertensis]MDH8677838.1 hypothetical protein [Fusibacter bizertensis]
MSDLFGKLKQGIDKSTKVIGAKSASLIDSNKVKSEISTLNKSKDELLSQVGLLVYEADPLNFSYELVRSSVEAIQSLDEQIRSKTEELEQIKLETEEKLHEINK